jgi:hypothetical protein
MCKKNWHCESKQLKDISMISIATLGPEGSSSWQAAKQFDPDAEIKLYPNTPSVIKAFTEKEAELALIPVYNTREGESIEYFRIMEKLSTAHWVDNGKTQHCALGRQCGPSYPSLTRSHW